MDPPADRAELKCHIVEDWSKKGVLDPRVRRYRMSLYLGKKACQIVRKTVRNSGVANNYLRIEQVFGECNRESGMK